MTKVTVTTRGGDTSTIDAPAGLSVMEALRDGGVDEIMALCGGCCSCATCHVYVDEAPADQFPAVSEDEDELLDSTEFRNGDSRLSCQLPLNDAIDHVSVTIAPED